MTVSEYLAFEAKSEIRHEFHEGEIFAMAGGTPNHGLISGNVITELNLLGRKSGCKAFNGDVKIRIDARNRFLYPDASYVCGPLETSEFDPNSLINPSIIVEVLSESTEAYDRGAKFRLYRMLPSLKEYILISQKEILVEVFSRKDANIWELRTYSDLSETLSLKSVKAEMLMEDIYRGVEGLA